MTLGKLKRMVDIIVENVIEDELDPEEITVGVQIDTEIGPYIWTDKNVDVHYDNDSQVSGCVIGAFSDAPEHNPKKEPKDATT